MSRPSPLQVHETLEQKDVGSSDRSVAVVQAKADRSAIALGARRHRNSYPPVSIGFAPHIRRAASHFDTAHEIDRRAADAGSDRIQARHFGFAALAGLEEAVRVAAKAAQVGPA